MELDNEVRSRPTGTGDTLKPVDHKIRRRGPSRYLTAGLSPFVFAVIFLTYCLWLGTRFADFGARMFDVYQNTPLLIVGLGLCVCMIAGQFDLSVTSTATLTCFLSLGLTAKQGLPFPVTLLICVAIGVAAGLFNAFLVLRLNVNAFIATVGSGGIIQGLSYVYSGQSQLVPSPGDKGTLPTWFTGHNSIGSFQNKPSDIVACVVVVVLLASLAMTVIELAGPERAKKSRMIVGGAALLLSVVLGVALASGHYLIPWTVVILVGLTTALWILLRYTTFGRQLYAIGGNPTAAGLAGINVRRGTTIAFIVSSLFAALAGVLLGGSQGAASPDIAAPYLLPAFAAVFLSTVLFSSGRFHVWGTVIGGYVVVTVGQGLIIGGLPFTWTFVVNGIVLVAAVALSTVLKKRQ